MATPIVSRFATALLGALASLIVTSEIVTQIGESPTMIDFAEDDGDLGDLAPWEDWRFEDLPSGPEYGFAEMQRQKDCCPWMFPMLWTKKDFDNRAAIMAAYKSHRP